MPTFPRKYTTASIDSYALCIIITYINLWVVTRICTISSNSITTRSI